jgi:hypothetical protein
MATKKVKKGLKRAGSKKKAGMRKAKKTAKK